ncbi:hypothetical protein SWZG_00127 [Synechococcus phage S-SKS1]|uniref:Uncharacterized protein n=1 Tax=Synechococcus phage S-SKS1 TaxID=754042 RepID=M4R1M8_9CAUD|nr:hypothetical protein SWZG_00127 [Synechococcus phage S-SKS1]AGH31637.1 hypothetical protein SWZG_00127 [Synechococcus phage S-SKS1]
MSRFGDLLGGKTPAPAPAAPAQPTPVSVPSEPVEAIAPEPTQEVFGSDVSIDEMSKDELEEYGRTVGIELDRRHSRRKLIKELKEHLTNS